MSSVQHEPLEVPQAVIDYLSSERTMTLATSTPGGIPYATTFLYVNDGPTIYFWTRATTIAARQIEANPTVAFTIDSYTGDLRAIQGVQGTGECSVLLNGVEIARVADLFGQRFPDLQPGTTMSISFFRIAPIGLNYIDNTEAGSTASAGTFGAEFHARRAFSIFAGLPVEHVDTIVAQMLPMRADAGETVVRAGGPADKFLVVVEGELEMISDRDTEPVVLGPGQFYGEMAILREAPRISTLRARTDVSLLAMEREDFRRLVAQSLGTTVGFEDIINARLHASAESLPTA